MLGTPNSRRPLQGTRRTTAGHLLPWHLQMARRLATPGQTVRAQTGNHYRRLKKRQTVSSGNTKDHSAAFTPSGNTKDYSAAFTSAALAEGATVEDLKAGKSLYFTNLRGHTLRGLLARCTPPYMIGTFSLIAAATFSRSFFSHHFFMLPAEGHILTCMGGRGHRWLQRAGVHSGP